MNQLAPLLATFEEAAEVLSVSARTVRRMVDARELPYIRVRGAVRVPYDGLRAWIAKNARSECPTVETTAPIGGSVTRPQAARELESLLAPRTGKKPRHLRLVDGSKRTG